MTDITAVGDGTKIADIAMVMMTIIHPAIRIDAMRTRVLMEAAIPRGPHC
jgi:hypothetical protein